MKEIPNIGCFLSSHIVQPLQSGSAIQRAKSLNHINWIKLQSVHWTRSLVLVPLHINLTPE